MAQTQPTAENESPVTYPDRIYNGTDFDTNINRAQSSDNLTTVLTDKNEVLGFPDHTSKQEMQAAIEADRNGSISTYKPTFYDKFIRQPLEDMGMAAFQPPFITDIKPTPERAFATSFARAATADVFKPEFSDQEAKSNPIPAFAGSLAGSVAAFATGGALIDGLKLDQLTPFAENIIKGGLLGGTYKGFSETSNELRDQDHPDLAKIGQGVLHDAMWWGGTGGLVGEASKPVGVAASAGLGYLMAKSDGADEPTALLNGAVLSGTHILQSHGNQEDVRQFVTDKLQSNVADYILAKNPMVHEEVAKQGGREYIANHAEDAIEQANQSILDKSSSYINGEPRPTEYETEPKGIGETLIRSAKIQEMNQAIADKEAGKPEISGNFEDGYDTKMLDYLAEYLPGKVVAGMSSEERLKLANGPWQDLRDLAIKYQENPAAVDFQKPILNNKSVVSPEGSVIEARASAARGKPNPIEEASKSPTILNQVMKNLTQEVMLKGGENASEGRESVEIGSGKEEIGRETQAGVHLRDNGKAEENGGEVANSQDKSLRQDRNKMDASLNTGEVGKQPKEGKEKQPIPSSLEYRQGEEEQSKSPQEKESLPEKTSKESIPQGEKGTSKIAESINQKAVEDKLTKGFENLAGYEKIDIKEQAQKATDFINKDEEGARSVIRGEKPLPEGLRGISLITAMEERLKTNPDADIAYELANSPLVTETSKAAQELRLAAERTPDSASSKLAEIKKAKIEEAGGDKNLAKSKESVKIKAKAGMDKLNLTDKESINLDKFLDGITC